MPKAPKKPTGSAAELIPDRPTVDKVRAAAKDCQACDLWLRGTQTVFGEGARKAELMLVGEQPGNDEDLSGHPFVGPAGKLLDRALGEAGIDRSAVYVTNVVKHFKWEPRGKRRIHAKPNAAEITACLPWLNAELELIRPRVLVCLGVGVHAHHLGGAAGQHGGAVALAAGHVEHAPADDARADPLIDREVTAVPVVLGGDVGQRPLAGELQRGDARRLVALDVEIRRHRPTA